VPVTTLNLRKLSPYKNKSKTGNQGSIGGTSQSVLSSARGHYENPNNIGGGSGQRKLEGTGRIKKSTSIKHLRKESSG
jgi:hypothetical protein